MKIRVAILTAATLATMARPSEAQSNFTPAAAELFNFEAENINRAIVLDAPS